uniref:Peptidase S1 domain-containing protein n=1 Tax=Gopherus agassizii TaxID=38772 RepID=A0A452IPG5_9SAUR
PVRLTVLSFLSPVCGQPVRPLPGIIKRIIGGRNAELGFFPWQALIVVEDMSRVPNDKNKKDAVNRTVEEIILHVGFDIQNYNHDIALVKLKEKVTMDAYVMPVCLPQFEHELEGPHPNTLGLVAGWGISNPNITVDEIISNYSVTENMFCAGYYEGGKDTCLGDSGGAFVIQDPRTQRWVAQGLVSWGGPEECGMSCLPTVANARCLRGNEQNRESPSDPSPVTRSHLLANRG